MLIVIIWLLESVQVWPKAILLSKHDCIADLHVVAGRRKPLEEEDRAGGQLNGDQGHQHPAGSVERLQEGSGRYDAGSFGNLAKKSVEMLR